jgi:DNA polymerase-1
MFFGIPSSIKNSKGKEIKGLIGFVGSIKKLNEYLKPYSIIVIFDSETSKDNNKLIDNNYKEGRTDYTDVEESINPFSQLPLIKKALDYLNIYNIEVESDEADDYIASIINNYKNNYQLYIVSSDTDFIQLIDDNTNILVQKGKQNIIYNKAMIKDKYNIYPSQYTLFKSLVGDKCDNVEGIKGIGPKTASKILEYGSIEKFINNSNEEKLVRYLIDNIDKINKNIKLITLNNRLKTDNILFNKISKDLINKKVNEIIIEIGEK